ncbi:hypothetical protein DCCM_4116 [Desulfocucumis palustris]|uniref:Uncharacterized protein n=1 Tax=Desulfocucumis palustris TaxID=1898651 RepID=A0A2L2XFJ4_9FIRM|nr:hypothetical protein DCCM_4116 [Desulfocucumis palustris]
MLINLIFFRCRRFYYLLDSFFFGSFLNKYINFQNYRLLAIIV